MPSPADSAVWLDTNLAALEHRWGWVPDISTVDTDAIGWDAGVTIRAPDGRSLPVHDLRDPYAEAERWIAGRWPSDRRVTLACVIGAGLGFVVESLLARERGLNVLVLEPEPALAVMMLARRDWTEAIAAGRLMLLAGPDYRGEADASRLARADRPPCVLPHPAICLARPDAAKRAARVVAAAIERARANDDARRRFALPYVLNTSANVRTIARERDAAALFGTRRGTPIVVAAAGPSLDRNIEELRPWRDRVTLVAVDTAARPLLAAGLSPDFIVAVDPSAVNARHITGLPSCPRTALVCEGSIPASALAGFADRSFVFRVGNHAPWPWLRSVGLDRAVLRAWGSVTTTAFDFALKLEGDPVVFIGADLAYSDDRIYCGGMTFEPDYIGLGRPLADTWRDMAHAPGTVEVTDINGGAVRTSPTLMAFNEWLMEQAALAHRAVWNATGAGILALARRAPLSTILAAAPVRTALPTVELARPPKPTPRRPIDADVLAADSLADIAAPVTLRVDDDLEAQLHTLASAATAALMRCAGPSERFVDLLDAFQRCGWMLARAELVEERPPLVEWLAALSRAE